MENPDTNPPVEYICGSGKHSKGGGGGSNGAATEDPNTLQSNTTARILDLISVGECRGLVNGANSIFFDSTELADTSGNYNFQGVTWDHREGLPDQDYMPGFSAAEEEDNVNVQVFNGSPIVRTYAGPIDAVRVSVEIPALSYQDPTTGNLHGASVEYTISIRPVGTATWTQVADVQLNNQKCVSPFEQSYRVNLGGTNDWEVMVTRISGDSSVINIQNQTWWATTTLITDGKFQYNDCAYLGYTVNAQLFGSSIPTRSCDYYGLLIPVPSNYDPATRVYTGNWDGTFKTEWSDNPAWVLYYVLTDVRYGLGKVIDPTQVDKWGLYTIAQYCDQLVPDGFGGMEPRYTFNYQINSMTDAYKVVQSIASVFRGLAYWSSGQVRIVADMPKDAVKLVTAANVKGGLFTYEGVAYSAQHSVALVTWYDPANQCNPTVELYEDPDLINGTATKKGLGWRPLQLTAYACTSRGQAHRMGKWAIDTEKNAPQTVNYEAAWDHIDIVPGDVIEVYDPDYQAVRMGGRIKAVNSNSVTTDAPITIEAGQVYTLRVIYPDGTLDSRLLNNATGSTSLLTFDNALAQIPIVGAIWAVSSTSLAPRQWVVVSIKEGADGFFTVSALFYDPTKYARIEQNIQLEPPVYSPYININVPAPISLAYRQFIYRANGTVLPSVTFSWSRTSGVVPVYAFQIQYQPPNQNWSGAIDLSGTSYDLTGIIGGLWGFRVRAIGFNGVPSAWTSVSALLNASTNAPPDVTNLAMALQGQAITLSWDPSTAPDVNQHVIEFSPVTSGASWASATILLPDVKGSTASVPAMVGTYLIKAVNVSGVQSLNAASVVTTAASLSGIDTIATINDAPTWSGTKTNTTVVGSLLKLAVTSGVVASSGTYQFANYYDLGAVYTARLTGQITAGGENLANTMSTWPTLASQMTMSGADPSDWNIMLQIRTTQTDPAASPVWSAWKPFIVGDYTCRAFEIMATLISTNQNVNIDLSSLAVVIGMARRTEAQNNLTTLTTGELPVMLSPGFYDTPSFVFTPHNASSGDYVSVTSKTATGCNISVYSAAGVRVAVTGDLVISGHGYGT